MTTFKGKKFILPTFTFFFLFFELSLILHFRQAEPMLVPHHNRCNFLDNEDEKSYVRSKHTSRVFQAPNLGHSFSGTHKWSTRADSRNELTRAMSVGRKAQKETRKVDSLDLYPFPPLVRQTSRLSRWENAKPVSTHNRDEKEEEFYSPRGFSGNCNSSNRNGSASKKVFATVPGGIFDEKVRGLQTIVVVWNRLGEKEEDGRCRCWKCALKPIM
ncbi:hypothetical protein ACFX2I_009615 [Malus domestica]